MSSLEHIVNNTVAAVKSVATSAATYLHPARRRSGVVFPLVSLLDLDHTTLQHRLLHPILEMASDHSSETSETMSDCGSETYEMASNPQAAADLENSEAITQEELIALYVMDVALYNNPQDQAQLAFNFELGTIAAIQPVVYEMMCQGRYLGALQFALEQACRMAFGAGYTNFFKTAVRLDGRPNGKEVAIFISYEAGAVELPESAQYANMLSRDCMNSLANKILHRMIPYCGYSVVPGAICFIDRWDSEEVPSMLLPFALKVASGAPKPAVFSIESHLVNNHEEFFTVTCYVNDSNCIFFGEREEYDSVEEDDTVEGKLTITGRLNDYGCVDFVNVETDADEEEEMEMEGHIDSRSVLFDEEESDSDEEESVDMEMDLLNADE
ncbi:hypothetical protein F5Y03DRAFT_393072 [Xylaria venustula]|nr:hypothetical protein F5Y03DRAFT_393072 [Xylaria venustula]